MVLQEQVNAMAHQLGLSEHAPCITPDLTTRITNTDFCHHDISDLTGGIQPFLCCHRSPENHTRLARAMAASDTIQQGVGAQLSDVCKLSASSQIDLPGTMIQTNFTLKSWHVLRCLLQGKHHPNSLHHAEFVHLWDTRQMHLESMLFLPASPLIIQHHQHQDSCWLNMQLHSTTLIPSPDRCSLTDHTEELQPWCLWMPLQLHAQGSPFPTIFSGATPPGGQPVLQPTPPGGGHQVTAPR